jgi:predicted flavoprotein YhiN
LHEFFLKRNEELWHKFLLGEKVQSIKKEWENFSIQLQNEQIETKNVIIACWWKSFPKIGGSDFVFHFANQYWIQTQ